MSPRRLPHRGGANGFEPRAVIKTRAHRAWDLEAMGRSQREIAAELGVSQPAVSRMLRRMADALAEERRIDDARQRARLSNRHDYLYREAVRGYERSQHDQTTRRQRQVTNADGQTESTIAEVSVTTRDGGPALPRTGGSGRGAPGHIERMEP